MSKLKNAIKKEDGEFEWKRMLAFEKKTLAGEDSQPAKEVAANTLDDPMAALDELLKNNSKQRE